MVSSHCFNFHNHISCREDEIIESKTDACFSFMSSTEKSAFFYLNRYRYYHQKLVIEYESCYQLHSFFIEWNESYFHCLEKRALRFLFLSETVFHTKHDRLNAAYLCPNMIITLLHHKCLY